MFGPLFWARGLLAGRRGKAWFLARIIVLRADSVFFFSPFPVLCHGPKNKPREVFFSLFFSWLISPPPSARVTGGPLGATHPDGVIRPTPSPRTRIFSSVPSVPDADAAPALRPACHARPCSKAVSRSSANDVAARGCCQASGLPGASWAGAGRAAGAACWCAAGGREMGGRCEVRGWGFGDGGVGPEV